MPDDDIAPAIGDLADKVTAIDPALLEELAAVAVAVDRQATALEVMLGRFSALEGRLCRAVAAIGEWSGATVGEAARERQFAALLDVAGSSAVRVRVEQLAAAFPD